MCDCHNLDSGHQTILKRGSRLSVLVLWCFDLCYLVAITHKLAVQVLVVCISSDFILSSTITIVQNGKYKNEILQCCPALFTLLMMTTESMLSKRPVSGDFISPRHNVVLQFSGLAARWWWWFAWYIFFIVFRQNSKWSGRGTFMAGRIYGRGHCAKPSPHLTLQFSINEQMMLSEWIITDLGFAAYAPPT